MDGHLPNPEIIKRYLAHQRNAWRPYTREIRARQIRQIAEQLSPATLHGATEENLLHWADDLRGSLETIGSYISAARGIYQWMVGYARLREDDPTRLLKRPHVPGRPPRPMPEKRYEKALGTAAEEMLLWIALMGCCGFRCCEIAWMLVDDVEELPDGTGLAHVVGKGGKRRTVPVGTPLMSLLRPHLRGSGPVFRRPSDGKAYTAAAVSSKTNTFLRSIGIDETAHTLRHRFGTDYHQLDSDLFRQALLMGHASVTTTQRYTAVTGEETALHIEELTRRRLSNHHLPPDQTA